MTIRNLNEVIITRANKYGDITPASCLQTYNDGCGYVGFQGGVELTPVEAETKVPVEFINSSKPIMAEVQKERIIINQEGLEEVETYIVLEPTGDVEQKTWKEYCLNTQSDTTGKYLATFLHVWPNGNRQKMAELEEALEWRKWYEYFGARLLTKSEFKTKKFSEEYIKKGSI